MLTYKFQNRHSNHQANALTFNRSDIWYVAESHCQNQELVVEVKDHFSLNSRVKKTKHDTVLYLKTGSLNRTDFQCSDAQHYSRKRTLLSLVEGSQGSLRSTMVK